MNGIYKAMFDGVVKGNKSATSGGVILCNGGTIRSLRLDFPPRHAVIRVAAAFLSGVSLKYISMNGAGATAATDVANFPAVMSILPSRYLQGGVDNETYATCDGCWCIPDKGSNNTCPLDPPQTLPDFPQAPWIDNLNALQLDNPLSLNCNPYDDESCDTEPPLVSGNACVWEVVIKDGVDEGAIVNSTSCANYYTYKLTTVPETFDEATAMGMQVTHTGACGLCSTFQDWSVYMTVPDLTEVGSRCGSRFLVNQTLGIQCFMDTGFTEGCANIWGWNSFYTSRVCPSCVPHTVQNRPNNMPPPTCYLAPCIQCDEDLAGPNFKKFSGRTRRNSGLLSGIARNCSTISPVQPVDPCTVIVEPTKSPVADGESDPPVPAPSAPGGGNDTRTAAPSTSDGNSDRPTPVASSSPCWNGRNHRHIISIVGAILLWTSELSQLF